MKKIVSVVLTCALCLCGGASFAADLPAKPAKLGPRASLAHARERSVALSNP